MDGPHPPQCGHWGACPYPLCRCATSSLPLLAFGHFPLTWGIGPLIRGVGPPGGGLRTATWCRPYGESRSHIFFHRGRSQTGPRLRTSYHLLVKARRGTKTASASIFHHARPQWAGRKDSARRKFCKIHQVRVPRNRGLGESRHWRTQFASAASPSVFWFLFHVEKELAAGAAKLPESPKNTHPADTSLRVRCRTDRAKNIKI